MLIQVNDYPIRSLSFPTGVEHSDTTFLLSHFMSENWEEIGKKLYDAARSLRIDAVKKIVTKFQRNPQVIDWKDEEVVVMLHHVSCKLQTS